MSYFFKAVFTAFICCNLLCTFLFPAFSQGWQNNIKNDSDFYSIRQAFDENFVSPEGEEDGEEKQFERWANVMNARVCANNGKPLPPDILYTEWKKFMKRKPDVRQKNSTWEYAGPESTPLQGGGNGRINCLKFHPGNTNIMWAGTPAGGLWKSVNGGKSWTTETDNLPNLGVTDIAINPRYPDSMFIATGDGYGYSIGNGNFWGGTYSMGVLMSIDGGESWQETGLNWQRNQTRQIFKMVMDPFDPNTIIATTNTGIWRTQNAGKEWELTKSGVYKEMLAHPRIKGLFFSTTSNSINYSEDTGKTWIAAKFTYTKFPVAMTLTIAESADSVMYALANSGTIYRSADYGKTWMEQSSNLGTNFQGWYDLALGVSPKNPDFLVAGGVDMVLSENGGLSWRIISNWYDWPSSYYVHADHRAIIFYPGSQDTFLSVNDGGIFKTNNSGQSWGNISSNIHALQFYKLGSASDKDNIYFAGAQDNGINRNKQGSWDHVMIGDGMECIVSHENSNVVYASTQNGNLAKSYNGGSSFNQYIYPAAGSWTTPIEMDANDADILYFGGKHLYRTENGGSIWRDITPSLNTGGEITSLEISPSDANTIYIAHNSLSAASIIRLRKTTDGGKTWTMITKGLPGGSNYLSDIASDPHNSAHIWVTLSGYVAANKVFESEDGGAT